MWVHFLLEIIMIEKNYYNINKSNDGIWLTPYKWSATERRLLQVESEKYKSFRAFELNYSKWATYNINKFEDITILKTFDKSDYSCDKGDHKVSLDTVKGDSYLEESQDTHYENWCGNLNVRKQFKDCIERDEYFELENFLEEKDNFKITNVQSNLQFYISNKDYLELKKIFKK
tara:strand:- start:42 stop:563 length:522 start_codon:yes stop_codon:yes gene_type:complete